MSTKSTSARSKLKGARSVARLAAVQVLYQLQFIDQNEILENGKIKQNKLIPILNEFLFDPLEPYPAVPDEEFFKRLVIGALENQADLDHNISLFLKTGWDVEKLDKVIRLILECGVFEMIHEISIPLPVVVSEYVDIAYAFYDSQKSGFINGVLQNMSIKIAQTRISKLTTIPNKTS